MFQIDHKDGWLKMGNTYWECNKTWGISLPYRHLYYFCALLLCAVDKSFKGQNERKLMIKCKCEGGSQTLKLSFMIDCDTFKSISGMLIMCVICQWQVNNVRVCKYYNSVYCPRQRVINQQINQSYIISSFFMLVANILGLCTINIFWSDSQ